MFFFCDPVLIFLFRKINFRFLSKCFLILNCLNVIKNYNSMDQLPPDILMRYLQNETNSEDLLFLNNWMKQSPGNKDFLFGIEELWVKRLLGRDLMHDRVVAASIKFKAKLKQRRKRFKILTISKYAAIAVLVIGAISFLGFFLSESDFVKTRGMNLIVADSGVKEVQLPDGSKIWLNEGGCLRCFSDNSDDRVVYLEGEAYFEVAKNEGKPFLVVTENLAVKVLGTSFNVRAQKGADVCETTLMNGSVELRERGNNGSVILEPGQKAELNIQNKRFRVVQVVPENEIVWKSKFITFKNATISEIARTLERFYNVKVVLGENVNGNTYSGALKRKETIDVVLQSLKNSIPIEYSVSDDTVFIDCLR